MRLHEQAKHYKALAKAREEALNSILSYVMSDKFSSIVEVNAADIILRIRESQNDILEQFGE